MPNLFSKPGLLKWAPDCAQTGAPPGVLLRADNLDFDEAVVARKRKGYSAVYSGMGATVHSLYTATINGTRYRFCGVDDTVYVNGVDLELEFDGEGDITFTSWLGHVFMARGTKKYKYDGVRVTNWGIPKPSQRLVAAAGDQVQEYISTMNQTESPAWSASEGSITGTYPDGADGSGNGSLEVTPAASGRATITRTFSLVTDLFNIDGYAGSDTDVVDLLAWFDKPEEVESLTLIFGVSAADVSDPFRDDSYTFTFKIGGADTAAPREEVTVKSVQAAAQIVYDAAASASITPASSPEVIGGPHGISDTYLPAEEAPPPNDSSPDVILEEIRAIPLMQLGPVEYRPDAAYNPGWTHLTVTRGQFTRQGTTTERDWSTVRAVRIVYKAKLGSTGKARFDSYQIYGGGDRALTGRFSFLYREVRGFRTPNGEYEYVEKSPPSEASKYVMFKTQKAVLTIPADAVKTFDPQTDQLWIYMVGGYLNDWYRVAVSGYAANDTTMAIDEFARSPDGNISAFDRCRLNQFGLSTPGELPDFVPSDISGLKVWLDAEYIQNAVEGGLISYWPGRDDGYSAFTPTDISSLKGWFKADANVYSDAGSTLAVEGDTVRQWNDQSGNGYHLSQSTAGNRPIYRTGVVNGKPAIRFDGLDDYLSGTTPSNMLTVAAKYVLTVFYANSLTTGAGLWSVDGSKYTCHTLHATNGLVANNYDGAHQTPATPISATTWYVGTFAHGVHDWTAAQSVGSGTSSGSFFGGLTTSASGNTSTSLAGTFSVGRAATDDPATVWAYLAGDIAEILVFNALPSQSERLKLERYLFNKYGLSYSFEDDSSQVPARAESASLQPTYRANWRNGRPAAYFSGSDVMEVCAALGDAIAADAHTIFIVGEVDALQGSPAGAGSVDNNSAIVDASTKLALLFYSGSQQALNNDGSNDFTTARAYALDAPYVWTVTHSSGTLYDGQNDTRTTSMNSVSSGNTATGGGLRIGAHVSGNANRFFKGYIAEVLIYNVALTEDERKQVESYLADKYGLTQQIPYTLTANFSEPSSEVSGDVVVTLAADEIRARIAGERLPAGLFRPPDDIISADADYANRLWALTSKGYLYFSERREPGMFRYSNAFKVAGQSEEPFWVKRTTQGVYTGTAKDIHWIYGTGEEDDATRIPAFTKVSLNVADPPISSMVCADGNDLIYMSARGPMRLSQNEVEPIPLTGVSLLWQGEDRHGIEAVNIDGRFRAAVSHGEYYFLVPEGDSSESTSAVWKWGGDRWRRFTYPVSYSSIYREPDGTVLAGTAGAFGGYLLELEATDTDEGNEVPIVLWTPSVDGGFPLNRKDPFDLTMLLDTGGNQLDVAVHADGSEVATMTTQLRADEYAAVLDDIDAAGTLRNVQLRMTGSFTTFSISDVNIAYRPRPQHRVHVDTGYLRKEGEDLVWYRQARLCMCAGTNVSVEFWFDDVLYATQNITVDAGITTVYEVPLGREYKGYQPRVVIRKQDQNRAEDGDGFELYWLELRQRHSGNRTNLDVRKIFTDLVIPLEQREKERANA